MTVNEQTEVHTMNERTKEIVQYYETCDADYRLFWDLDRSLALHAGYWDGTTQTLHEALARENQILAEVAKIRAGDHVLDAGCGVGGSSIYLASYYQCKVTGITLSPKQAQEARQNAQRLVPGNMPDFQVMDFIQTSFPSESFDVVWGIESVCHADDKRAFMREAFRLLKKGGRLVVADGFALNKHYNPEESRIMSKWLKGWGVESLGEVEEFRSDLIASGFSDVSFNDITENILPSSRRLFLISFPAYALSKAGELLGLRSKTQTENIKSAYYQYQAIKKELWKYGIYFGVKK